MDDYTKPSRAHGPGPTTGSDFGTIPRKEKLPTSTMHKVRMAGAKVAEIAKRPGQDIARTGRMIADRYEARGGGRTQREIKSRGGASRSLSSKGRR